jgi:hypothetical protein
MLRRRMVSTALHGTRKTKAARAAFSLYRVYETGV